MQNTSPAQTSSHASHPKPNVHETVESSSPGLTKVFQSAQLRPQQAPPAPPVRRAAAPGPSAKPKDDLARVFNTVLVSTQTKGKRDFSAELSELNQSPAFKAVLSAVRQLSCIHGLTERQAAEQIITTFRKLDQLWGDYVYREGLDKIRAPKK